MPAYAYVARTSEGQRVTGSLTANSEREALAHLSTNALFPIEVKAEKPRQRMLFGGRVKGHQLANFYSQLSALLKSGVPLLRSIKILQDQSSNQKLKEVLEDVHRRIEDGSTLGDAMARHQQQVFGELAISMIRAGSEGGFLEEALERVALFTEQQEDLKSRTTGAMAYPAFLAAVGTIVVTGLLVYFVPNFAPIFDSLREKNELPKITDWLLNFSEMLRKWWYLWLLAIGFLVGFLRMHLTSERGRWQLDLFKIKAPVIGDVFQSLAVSRFCRVLGTLIRNGVPILKSLNISRDASGNRILSEAIAKASENISSGESLSGPLAQSGHFPRTVVEMISVAEEANTLDTVLIQVADGLEKRTERKLEIAVKLLEPIMLLILASVILFVVIALMVPILKMSATV